MRAAITSLPPIFPELHGALHLSAASQSVLAAIPVLCFGLFSGIAAPLSRAFGEERVLGVALVLLAAGLLLRGAAPSALLLPGTVIAGSAIALMNVLLPSLVKRRRPERAGLLIGLYLMALSIGGHRGLADRGAGVPGGGRVRGGAALAGHVGAAGADRGRGLAAAASLPHRAGPGRARRGRARGGRAGGRRSRRGGRSAGAGRRRSRAGPDAAGLAGHGVHGAAEPDLLRHLVLVPDHLPGSRHERRARGHPAGGDEPGQRGRRAAHPGAGPPAPGSAAAGAGLDRS